MTSGGNGSKKRLYRQVVDQILQLIESGEYPVGSRLPPERELSERFGVSRPTIREAVIALEAKDRVAVKTGSGVYVLEVKVQKGVDGSASPFELKEARVLVEGEAAALAATMITDDQLQALEQALIEMERENEAGDIGSDTADQKFHTIIAEATNNCVLFDMIAGLWSAQQRIHHIKIAHRDVCTANPEARIKEHRDIYEALVKRDPQAARIAMRKHFARSIAALHKATEEEAVDEVQRKLSAARERFSIDRLNDTASIISSAE